jgi:hypothetical protein
MALQDTTKTKKGVQCPQHKSSQKCSKNKKGPHAANPGTVRNRLLINPKLYCTAPQTADLVAMATCHLSWAINIFFLPGFTGTKSNLKRLRKFKLITLEQGMLSTTAIVECEIYIFTFTGHLTGK